MKQKKRTQMSYRHFYLAVAMITMVLFMVNLVSAALEQVSPIDITKGEKLTFDDKEIAYNDLWEKYSPIQIKDNWDIPLLSSVKLEGYLDKHTENCGSNCESEMVLKLYERGVLIDDIRFVGGDVIDYKLRIKTGEKEIEVPDYDYVCVPTGKTNLLGQPLDDCSYQLSGSHTILEPTYENYNLGDTVEAGVYIVNLVGNKKADVTTDWQIMSQGKWIEEWSVWGSANPYFYYRNNSNPVILDRTTDETQARGMRITMTNNTYILNVTKDSGCNATDLWLVNYSGGGLVGHYNASNMVGDTWITNVKVSNTQGIKVMMNRTVGFTKFMYYLSPPGYPYTSIELNWITGIYNNGADDGSTYNNILSIFTGVVNNENSTITLVSPVNHYNSTSNLVQFNVSASVIGGATLTNISLWTNTTGVWARDSTNVFSVASANTVINKTFFNAGKYLWGIQACDSDGACGWSENRTINVSVGASPTFGLCGVGDNIYPIVNYTFRDSSTLATLSAYILSSFNYSSTANVTNATYTYNSGTEFASFAFCGSHQTTTYTYYPTIQYASAGYPLTTYTGGKHVNGSSVYNLTLNLTALASSAYQQFYVTDAATGAYLQGASIVASTATDGVVASGTTDSGGSLALFLDPTKTHTVVTTKDGYPNNTRTVNPSDTVVVYIALGSAITIPPELYLTCTEGVTTSISPTQYELTNRTSYNFVFTVNHGICTITKFGFHLYNSTNDEVGSDSDTTNGGTTNYNFNVGNNTKLKMIAYYTANGITNTVSKEWTITNTDGSGFSILTLANRLKTYIASGMFGLKTGFGLNLICFFIILVTTGIFSYKYGFDSIFIIATIATIQVFLLEMVLGLIQISVGNLPLTIWCMIITMGIGLREWNR